MSDFVQNFDIGMLFAHFKCRIL